MHLDIRRGLLQKLIEEKGWRKVELARRLGINYSHLLRVLKGERSPGNKFFFGFQKFCKEENLLFEDYVYIKIQRKKLR